jgi:hypothetical protein
VNGQGLSSRSASSCFARLRKVGFEPVDVVAVVRHNKTLEMGNYRKAAEEGNFFLRGFKLPVHHEEAGWVTTEARASRGRCVRLARL